MSLIPPSNQIKTTTRDELLIGINIKGKILFCNNHCTDILGIEKKQLLDIGISGDFTLYPKKELQNLEYSLKDTEREKNELKTKIDEFYEKTDIQTPGVNSNHLTKAIMEAKKE